MKQYKKQFLIGVIILVLLIISCRNPTFPSIEVPNIIWTKIYGGREKDIGYSVQETTDGGYIIAGSTYSFGEGTPSYSNVYLIKTDENGDTQQKV
ncbi:hypothetical protein ES703_78274 [subsurface metagenome]